MVVFITSLGVCPWLFDLSVLEEAAPALGQQDMSCLKGLLCPAVACANSREPRRLLASKGGGASS